MNMHVDPQTPPEEPNFLEAEQQLLGALMMNNQQYYSISSLIEPFMFYEPLHGDIFAAIQAIIIRGRSANPGSVRMEINNPDRMIAKDVSLSQYLASLLTSVVGTFAVVDQARGILEAFSRRRMIHLGRQMIELGFQEGNPLVLADKATEMQTKTGSIVAALEGREEFSGQSLLEGYLNMISKDPQQRSKHGVPILFPELRAILSEQLFEAKNLYGMLSSSGEGKSSATMQLIYHAASQGHPVCFFSYDQTGEQCVAQMVAQHTAIEARRQKTGDLTPKDHERASDFAAKLAQFPFEVIDCDSDKDTVERLTAKAKRFLKKHANGKTPFFVFDHMSAIPNDRHDKSADEGTKALKKGAGLKSLAKATNSACLVLQQRSGAGMKRFNPRPIAADLYGGEAARQPFDGIFYLFRAEEHMSRQVDTAKDEREKEAITQRFTKLFPADVGILNTAEVGGIKVRFGRNGQKRYLNFVAEYTRYESRDRTSDFDQRELI